MEITWPELNRKMMDPILGDDPSDMTAFPSGEWDINIEPYLRDEGVDLTAYINTSALKVQNLHFRLNMQYICRFFIVIQEL